MSVTLFAYHLFSLVSFTRIKWLKFLPETMRMMGEHVVEKPQSERFFEVRAKEQIWNDKNIQSGISCKIAWIKQKNQNKNWHRLKDLPVFYRTGDAVKYLSASI